MAAPTLPPENVPLSFPEDGGCFGCSPRNESGLGLSFVRTGDSIVADYTIPERFHGAPGIAHGGIVATIFDEVSCAAAVFLRDRRVVTGELSVRYNLPCPVEAPLRFKAHIEEESHSKYAVIVGELSKDDDVLARSTGKFFYSPRNVSAP